MGRQIPQRIEVLLKKASVDPVFKTTLLELRGEAAQEIGLSLDPAEAAMLRAAPREQLESIIAATSVPAEHRRAFLGQAAAAMLAALGIATGRPGTAAEPNPGSAIADQPMFGGVRPDSPARQIPNADLPPGGVRPDLPDKKPKTLEQRVTGVIAKQLKIDESLITRNKKPVESLLLVDDLEATAAGLVDVRKGLEKEFTLKIPGDTFKKARTVGATIDYVKKAVEKRKPVAGLQADVPLQAVEPPPPAPYPVAGGVRPK
jgi:acyl carrier protein